MIKNGIIFETGQGLIDVTSMHRPDVTWVFIDAQKHVHEWYVNGTPATSYDPSATYDVPSLIWVKDGEEYWEDDDQPHDVGHLECRECGEHVGPRYTADTETQYIGGLRWHRIDGTLVLKEEFDRRLAEEQSRT